MFFFFNDTATTEIYTLSLHDALPIFDLERLEDLRLDEVPDARLRHHGDGHGGLDALDHRGIGHARDAAVAADVGRDALEDRKSTRLNSSHANISYAVFCLKKKK